MGGALVVAPALRRLEAAVTVPEANLTIGGKYRVLRQLGEGGMGAVYEVENLLTGKIEALKWLHPRLRGHAEIAPRVMHEARAMARIRHRNVVDVYDVVIDGDDIALVMERLEGELLSELIARRELYVDELVAILVPALRGVSAAHAVGVIHRDIKPENIFMSIEAGEPEPVPKIIDFGIAKVFDLESAHTTRSGVTMGTPRYVSYEQLCGARDVDGRTDVYSFGVILYEALTGRAPYEATNLGEQAVLYVTTVPPSVHALCPKVPTRLAGLVERATARDRAMRPSVDALIAELTPFAQPDAYLERLLAFPQPLSQASTAVESGVATKLEGARDASARGPLASGRPARRPRAPRLALAAGLLALAILTALSQLRTDEASVREKPERADPSAQTHVGTEVAPPALPVLSPSLAPVKAELPRDAEIEEAPTPAPARALRGDSRASVRRGARDAREGSPHASLRKAAQTVDLPDAGASVQPVPRPEPEALHRQAEPEAPSVPETRGGRTAPRGGPLRREEF